MYVLDTFVGRKVMWGTHRGVRQTEIEFKRSVAAMRCSTKRGPLLSLSLHTTPVTTSKSIGDAGQQRCGLKFLDNAPCLAGPLAITPFQIHFRGRESHHRHHNVFFGRDPFGGAGSKLVIPYPIIASLPSPSSEQLI